MIESAIILTLLSSVTSETLYFFHNFWAAHNAIAERSFDGQFRTENIELLICGVAAVP